MKRKPFGVVAIAFVITIGLFCLYNFVVPYVWFFWVLLTAGPYVDKTPEELFNQYVLDGDLHAVSKINFVAGLERSQPFVPLKGPVYILFETDNNFIDTLIKRESQYYKPYVEISCHSFLKAVQSFGDIERYPDKFQWWLPGNNTASFVCYRSERITPLYEDEAKYLLVDRENNRVYFFRTVTPLTMPD